MANKFLLENTTWPPGELEAAGQPSRLPERKSLRWIAETADYGIEIIDVRNDQTRAGWQRIYLVVHKQHEVSAAEARTLGGALASMELVQSMLDKATGKDTSVGNHGVN